MHSLEDFECYDHLTFDAMANYGYSVTEVPWRSEADWNDYHYVIIRSPWDYQDHTTAFLSVLEDIDKSSATLLNPISTVEWNINKHYLRELSDKGVAIVPTIWGADISSSLLNDAFGSFNTPELIIKPAISANADDTYRILPGEIEAFLSDKKDLFLNRQFLLQPFIEAIVSEGEYSLFYFNGKLSHCILKTPKDNDFRVQEEHGGRLQLIAEPEESLLKAGQDTLNAIPDKLLYARLDFVRHEGGFAVMEAELIEPSLYFNLDPGSPARFARAFEDFVKDLK
jgi:glutathione synthase/RimK-type ligase-like ATP-grasp enzyme